MVEPNMTQEPPHPPNFHKANIQSLTAKRFDGESGPFVKQIDKIKFLQGQCEEKYIYSWLSRNIPE